MVQRFYLSLGELRASYLATSAFSRGSAGAKTGDTWLLLHGLGGSGSNWAGFMELAEKYVPDFRAVAPDLLGHGESSAPETRYSVDLEVSFIWDFLRALGVNEASVAGNSLGGWIAMKMTLESKVRSLVLVDSGGIPGYKPRGLDPRDEEGAKQLLERIFVGENWHSAEMARKLLASRDGKLGSVVRSFLSSSENSMSWREISEIAAPTLLVWGSEDGLIPLKLGKALASAIRGSRMVILDGVGHEPMLEDPAFFFGAAIGWMLSHRRRTRIG